MKKLLALILANLLISGCMSSPVPMPTATIISDTTTTPIPVLTSTIIPTNTPEIITNICLESKAEVPRDDVNGIIVLNGAYLFYDKSVNHYVLNPDTVYLWDIKNNTKIELFHQKGEELNAFSTSPNHKSLVYAAWSSDGASHRVTVVNANGKLIRNVVDEYKWLGPYGWLDDQNLAIWMLSDVKDGPPFPTLIFNPFTWDSKLIMPDYPNIFWWHLPHWNDTLTVYNPSEHFVLYPVMGNAKVKDGIALWDVNNHKQIAFLPLASPDATEVGNPIWSPDGERFLVEVILEGHQTPELYIANRNGEIQQVTHFEDLVRRKDIESNTILTYSWSDDGRFIAFWYHLDKQGFYRLALLDTSTEQTRNLCITNQDSNIIKAPIWSPDSTQLLISKSINQSVSPEDYRVILVNIKDNYMVEIAKSVFPEG